MNRLYRLSFVFAFLMLTESTFAERNERWTNYTVNEGLLDNYIECLLEDNKGYLWIGTWSGISRFDGHEYKHYRKGITDSNSLPGNWIYCIYQDKSARIWAGTDEGIALYNPQLNEFQTVTGIGRHAIVSIKEDSKGNIWASGDTRLYQIDPIEFKTRFSKTFHPKDKSAFEIGPMAIDHQDILWIGTSNRGVIKFNTQTLSSDPLESNPMNQFLKDQINSINIQENNKIFIGTKNEGMYYWNEKERIMHKINPQSHDGSALENLQIKSVYEDKYGHYYMVNPSGDIYKQKLPGNFIEKVEFDFFYSEDKLFASCILIDRNGNEWIGTHGNGLLNRNRQKEKFLNIASSGRNNSGNKISSLLSLTQDKILVGTDGAGLYLFDRNKLEYKPVNLGPALHKSKVLNIAWADPTKVWLSFWGNGFALFDVNTLKLVKHFPGKLPGEPNFTSKDIKKILQCDSLLWIVSNGDGLFVYNLNQKKFIDRNLFSKKLDLTIPKWGNSIAQDSKGRIWISTSKGLYLIHGEKLTLFVRNASDPKSIISNLIMSVYEDSSKRIWIITDSGLELYDETRQGFLHYSSIYKIPQQLKAIIEDQQGRLWLSSNEGITCFDPISKKTYPYTLGNGLPSNVFYHQAASITSDGHLLFGSLNGFTLFHPDSLAREPKVAKVVFTDLLVNYVTQAPSAKGLLNTHIQTSKEITIGYSENIITFKFISIDLCNAQNLRYSYQLIGQNKSWVDIEQQHSVSFSNLAPGTYELKILARNSGGLYSNEPASMIIHILPPWYLSTWAYIIYSIIAIAILYAVYYLLRLKFKTTNALLMKEFEHRKELELYQSKINFFTSISHDIRTPVTLILAPLEMIKGKSSDNKEALKLLNIMEKNAHNLLELTNELLDFKNLESGSRTLNKQPVNLKSVIQNVSSGFDLEIAQKEISFSMELQDTIASMDTSLMKKVLNNLFINAIKFTPGGGNIKIVLKSNRNTVAFSIYNSGSSISPDLQSKIFDPFYTSENNQGFGLGLAIAKEIINLHKGNITASNSNDGVLFKIELPNVTP